MKKHIKKVSLLLGGVNRPTVALYESAIAKLTEKEAEQLNKELFRLSFGYWSELPDYYRRFFLRLYIHDRERLLRYVLQETPLGEMRYKLHKPDLFIQLMHGMEASRKDKKVSYRHLSISLLLGFEFRFTPETLNKYLKQPPKSTQPSDLLYVMGLIEVEDDYA